MKVALITGVTGQDGSYLAELLLKKGYIVHGIVRRSSSINTWRIDSLFQDKKVYNKYFFLHYGDVTDTISFQSLLLKITPDEVYNLAAQSHVKVSFEIPEVTAQIDAISTLKILEAIKKLDFKKKTKVYQASTSELLGVNPKKEKQNEKSSFYPRSPYGVAKLYAYWIIKNYREAYDFFACNGILFNHESERRSFNFVSRKITLGLARIYLGYQKELVLGNLSAKRDWGYAPEYVDAMWRILQQEKPEDFVIATEETHSVREFVEVCMEELGKEIIWEGEGVNEIGIDKKTKETIIRVDAKYFRPTEIEFLLGDASKARKKLGWTPKTKFQELAKKMMQADINLIKANKGKFFY